MTGASDATQAVRDRYRNLVDAGVDEHEWAYAWRTELNRGGFAAWELLRDEIVDTGKCVGCAACVTACPTDVFDYADELPIASRPTACVNCVLCADVCPVLRPPDQDLSELLDFRPPRHTDVFGTWSYGMYVRATDPEIQRRSQDGGLVSALLIHQLETGQLRGAVVGDVIPETPQIGRHTIATNRDEVLASAGSRYTYSPNTVALREAMEKEITPLAVVGVPCQVDAVRLQQYSGIRISMANWYRRNVSLVIGLFCSESFTHESIEKLGEMIGVDPLRIENINIKGKVVVRLDDGEVIDASLKEYGKWARPACLYCVDYSTENADIGAGGIGLDGWTYTLVRTEAGHRAVQDALDAGVIETRPLEDEPRGPQLLERLSALKKKNRPHPARMPTYQQRAAEGFLDPKRYYTHGPGAPKEDA
jgi:coenzyme F420 hydrogenase subunit beta